MKNATGVVIADAAGQNGILTLAADFPNERVGLEITNLNLGTEVRLGATSDFRLLQRFDSQGNLFFSQPPIP